jgi:hypothetical protein
LPDFQINIGIFPLGSEGVTRRSGFLEAVAVRGADRDFDRLQLAADCALAATAILRARLRFTGYYPQWLENRWFHR